jgi:hypothetical protein
MRVEGYPQVANGLLFLVFASGISNPESSANP